MRTNKNTGKPRSLPRRCDGATIPGHIGALDVARLDAPFISAVVVVRSILRTPLPVVPLANESAPVLNIQFDTSCHRTFECSLLGRHPRKAARTSHADYSRRLEDQSFVPWPQPHCATPVFAGASWNCTSLKAISPAASPAGSAFPYCQNHPPIVSRSLLAAGQIIFQGDREADCTPGLLIEAPANYNAKSASVDNRERG